jgi:penicillin-binding protein 1A
MAKQTVNKKIKKKKKKPFRILKGFIITIFILILISGMAGVGVFVAVAQTAPALDLEVILHPNQPSVLYDDSNEEMDEVPTEVKREIASIDSQIPADLQKAVTSIEDERFYKHNGIDVIRIVGASLNNAKKFFGANTGLHGASTITQQLIKNTMLTGDVKMTRKIQEAYLAMQLEKSLSKKQILEAYLNTIYLGSGAYGVQKGAQIYFNKDVSELNTLECAFIAGLTQNPSLYSPLNGKASTDSSIYINRTLTVLSKMRDTGVFDETTYDKYKSELQNNGLKFNKNSSSASSNKLNYEWFSRPVIKQVKNDLVKKYKYSDDEAWNLLENRGLKIYTTMDANMQKETQDKLNDPKLIPISQTIDGIIQPQAAATIMDYNTGQVKAMVGGRGDQPASSLNRAYNGKYAIGSTIKPLAVYSPAIDTKVATAGTVLEDSPLPAEIGKKWPDAKNKPYNPNNYDFTFSGYLTLRDAIRSSINLYAIKLENNVGLDTGASYLQKFGVPIGNTEKQSIAALSLGEISGSSPINMAAAYGTFGNNGMYTQPILYTKVVDRTGKVLIANKPENYKILSAQSSYIMYDLLKGVVASGTGTAAKLSSMPTAGKTGTASDSKNLWFCGLTPYYSASVWIGYDKPKALTGYSSYNAALAWSKFMEPIHNGLSVKDIEKPSGITTATICKDSGKLASSFCNSDPRGDRTYTEMFIEGTEPTEYCDTHVQLEINKNNGKLATSLTPDYLKTSRVYIKRNYTPSAYLADQQYVAPTEYDNSTTAVPNNTQTQNGTNMNNTTGNTNQNTNTNNTQNTNTNTNKSSNNQSNTNNNQNTTTPTDKSSQEDPNKKNKDKNIFDILDFFNK